mgnify:CR=1 FL=1
MENYAILKKRCCDGEQHLICMATEIWILGENKGQQKVKYGEKERKRVDAGTAEENYQS